VLQYSPPLFSRVWKLIVEVSRLCSDSNHQAHRTVLEGTQQALILTAKTVIQLTFFWICAHFHFHF